MSKIRIYEKSTGKAYYVDRNNDEYLGNNGHDSYYNHVINGKDVAYEYHSCSGRISGSGHTARVLNKNFSSNRYDVEVEN